MRHQPVGGGVTAQNRVRARREIGCFLDPGLFSGPAYDILLTLLAAEGGDRPLNVVTRLRQHLDRERSEVEQLLAGIDDIRHPSRGSSTQLQGSR